MRRFFFTIISIATVMPIAARAADAPKLTLTQTIALSSALRNLDGRMVVVKQNGNDTVIMQPWEFGSGSLRLRIASDIAIADSAIKTAEDARQAISKELTQKASKRTGEATTELKPGTPEGDEYQKQYQDLLAAPASGTQDLGRIKASELKLDRNEIPVTVLSALAPILDNDSPK